MPISQVQGTDAKKAQRWFCDFNQQWSGLIGRCNWYDFTLIQIGGEFAPYTGRWEFDVALVGFSVRITYVYDNGFNEMMMNKRDQIVAELEGRTGLEVKDPFGVLDEIDGSSPREPSNP